MASYMHRCRRVTTSWTRHAQANRQETSLNTTSSHGEMILEYSLRAQTLDADDDTGASAFACASAAGVERPSISATMLAMVRPGCTRFMA
ncbi:hypothetical protein K523DRAFT_323737 [Schizophyllum commune Tattone D]|nr:hypothetical protein K523DRAFT_323737 [Schizophyllum commune Tattone D]